MIANEMLAYNNGSLCFDQMFSCKYTFILLTIDINLYPSLRDFNSRTNYYSFKGEII